MRFPRIAWLAAALALCGPATGSVEGDSLSQTSPAGGAQSGNPPNYDDRQIRHIKRGETTEAQLLEWFGAPETREVNSDGRSALNWSWKKLGPAAGGTLSVRISSEGTVEAYSARRHSAIERRTVDFTLPSGEDMRKQMEQWRREGWNVHTVSPPSPQADGTVKRKANLSRNRETAQSNPAYEDKLISAIRRGETTEAQLLEWFGPACSRDLEASGRMELAWTFGETDPDNAGQLRITLAPDGKVDAYAAHRGH